jgi:hypothetical protein
MFKLDEKVLNVAGHTDTTPAGCIVSLDVNTRKFVAGHIELDPMDLLENITDMVEVFYSNILHPKVINNETELDGMPFAVQKAWGSGWIRPCNILQQEGGIGGDRWQEFRPGEGHSSLAESQSRSTHHNCDLEGCTPQ